MSEIIKKVRKRDGRIVDFDKERITNAIFSAAKAVGGRDRRIAEMLSNEVVRILEERYAGTVPSVEDIQDIVEKVLIERGHARTAKAYILYRKRHDEIRQLKSTFLEVERVVDDYLGGRDWRVKENSNMGYSLSGLLFHIATSVVANYTLDKVYSMEVADAHTNGDMHVHDLGMGITGYCAGWSLGQLLAEGFNGVPGKVSSRPPAHLDTALLQMANFVGTLQNEWAGAQAFNSVDTLLAPFVRKDKLDYKQVRQAMQTFVFNLNISSRWGGQTPFTNITLDLTVPQDLAGKHAMVGGKLSDDTYEDYTEEMSMINKALMEVMTRGDMNGRPFSVTGDTKIPIVEDDKVIIKTIEELYNESPGASIIKPLSKRIFVSNDLHSHIKDGTFVIKHPHEGEIYEITTDRGKRIKVSPAHSLFTLDDNLNFVSVKASSLKVGDVVVLFKNIRVPEKNHEIKLKRYSRKGTKGKSGCEWVVSKEISLEVNENIAWCLGYFLGDGCFHQNRISLAPASKEECELVIKKFTEAFPDINKPYIKKNAREIIYSDKGLSELFKSLFTEEIHGKGKGNRTKHIPAVIWTETLYNRKAFLEGYYQADGSKKQSLIKIGDASLLNEIKVLLLSVGVTFSENGKKVKGTNYLLLGNDVRIKNPFGKYSKKDKHSSSRVGSRRFRRTEKHFREKVWNWINSDLTVNTIEKINRHDFKGFLFDITADGNFMNADGLLLHNTFPIPTFSLTKDFEWDNGVSSALFEMTAKYGLPYFQNFINSNLRPSDVRSMCCHLMLDLAELRRNVTGGLFGSGDSTGSVGVVTINMPRLGYLSKNEDEFFERLELVMELARSSLETKREIVTKNMENGLLPFTKRYLGTLGNHFSTIGLIGMNEALLNLFGQGIASDEGKKFAAKTLNFMLERIRRFQEETGNIYNLEATPAEGVSYRLAKLDRRKYPDMITAGEKAPYYTNSTCLPVNSGLDLISALKHQEELQTLYTGGTVHHIFLGESLEDGDSCMNLVKKVAHNTRLPYFTVTPTYTICDDHGFIPGEYPKCPSCGKDTEVYSRVVGYYRPVKNWNTGKQEEFRQRIEYT